MGMLGGEAAITTKAMIGRVIAEGLGPELEAAGFTMSGHTWRLAVGRAVELTQVQGSRRNVGDEGRFTMNLAVYHEDVDALVRGPPLPKAPLITDCEIRIRIGRLLPAAEDAWWQVHPATDFVALAEEVRDVWRAHARGWLTEHTRPTVAEIFATRHGRFQWASAAAHLRGDHQAAALHLAEAITRDSRQAKYLRDWGRRKGIPAS